MKKSLLMMTVMAISPAVFSQVFNATISAANTPFNPPEVGIVQVALCNSYKLAYMSGDKSKTSLFLAH